MNYAGKVFIQALVRFYADYRIKQHASLRLLRDRLIFLFSTLMSYSQGGMVLALATLSNYILYSYLGAASLNIPLLFDWVLTILFLLVL